MSSVDDTTVHVNTVTENVQTEESYGNTMSHDDNDVAGEFRPELNTITYARNFDEHVMHTVNCVLNAHGEWATPSHTAWLHRMFSRVLLRQIELDRRENDLMRREAALHRNGRKSRRHGNGNQRPHTRQAGGASTESSAS